jgi:hypothetical protein
METRHRFNRVGRVSAAPVRNLLQRCSQRSSRRVTRSVSSATFPVRISKRASKLGRLHREHHAIHDNGNADSEIELGAGHWWLPFQCTSVPIMRTEGRRPKTDYSGREHARPRRAGCALEAPRRAHRAPLSESAIEMTKYFAHSENKLGAWNPLRVHLNGVAERARDFAEVFGAGDAAYLAGLLHDLGKYGDLFQRRLEGKEKVSIAGLWAQACALTGTRTRKPRWLSRDTTSGCRLKRPPHPPAARSASHCTGAAQCRQGTARRRAARRHVRLPRLWVQVQRS